MSRSRVPYAVTGLTAAVCLMAAACGGTSTTASTTPANPTTAAPTTAAAAGSLTSDNFGPGCAAVPKDGAGSFSGMAKDPAATAASNNPALSTLVSTVKAAGLVDTLNGAGPFTIFAPSNDAFAKINKATVEKLLADPKGDLTKILTYHVIAGKKLNADQLASAGTEKTVNGAEVKIAKAGDTINVNGQSAVVCGNVQTANATVMIIDTVLMPPMAGATTPGSAASASLTKDNFGPGCAAVPKDGAGSFSGMAKDPSATAASNNPALSTLVSTVKAAGLVDTLNGAGPFTIFAPSNDAFAKIDKATVEKLLADPKGDLTKILTYHVIAGKKMNADQLATAGKVKTVNGGELTIAKTGDTITVNGTSAVVCGNVQTANGTVFIIDTVLMPKA
jgi:transforming growth factor-beta-induced protein